MATVSSDTADPDLTNNTATFKQLVVPSADVGITKLALGERRHDAADDPRGTVGGTFDYQLTVTNSGPSAANAVTVTDTLPTNITLVAATPAALRARVGRHDHVHDRHARLRRNAITLHLIVSMGGRHGLGHRQHRDRFEHDSGPGPDQQLLECDDRGHARRRPRADQVRLTADGERRGRRDLHVRGHQQRSGEETRRPTGSGPRGRWSATRYPRDPVRLVSSCTRAARDGDLQRRRGGGAERHRVLRRPDRPDAGTVQNQANVAAAAAGGFPELDDPIRPTTTRGVGDGQPAGRRVAGQDRLGPESGTDDEVVYTLTASNAGPNDATGVTITDSLPAGLDFLDASPGCENNNGTVTCDVGTIASGDNASVTIAVLTTAAWLGPP